ncbi:MAG TPA: phytanoyl-CoA dioxygenase family protein, partial [Caulobacteraceae bacterium]|nr:phytanoyl-CoA dioxygenase family protein [Caulobacteraceae bacterium]
LHSDAREEYQLPPGRVEQAARLGVRVDGEPLDHRTRQLIFVRTPPRVTINFLMSDLTWENGPIRQIPGTQVRPDNPPSQSDEPAWMRLSTLVGAPAGAGVIRDTRAWHGATPNLSREIRAMPNVEYGAPWLDEARFAPSMPYEIWKGLSPHARKIAGRIKTRPGEWPAGAGTLHPLASARAKAKAEGAG